MSREQKVPRGTLPPFWAWVFAIGVCLLLMLGGIVAINYIFLGRPWV